ncbi:unnamed protein product [Prorocentrum cordatum]|uniref:Synaptotagmin SMP domain-containing protein n=1 Tax=Prorocentrum cordatum TaxID=2364126 RepID=A0ABN9V3U9_9DINO|nr:unnamed protein product [Polarella glacialis]
MELRSPPAGVAHFQDLEHADLDELWRPPSQGRLGRLQDSAVEPRSPGGWLSARQRSSGSLSQRSSVYFDALEGDEPLTPTPTESILGLPQPRGACRRVRACVRRAAWTLADGRAPAAAALSLGAGGYCLALAEASGEAPCEGEDGVQILAPLLAGCLAAAALPLRFWCASGLIGGCLLSLALAGPCSDPREEGARGACQALAYAGAGLAFLPHLRQLAVGRGPGRGGLGLGLALSAGLAGGAAARRRCPLADGRLPAAAAQLVAQLLLEPVAAALPTRNGRRLLPSAMAARAAWFWRLAVALSGLACAARRLGGPWPLGAAGAMAPQAALSPAVAGLACYVAGWDEVRALQLISAVLGVGMLLLPVREAGGEGVAAHEAALRQLLLAAVPLAGGAVGACSRGLSSQHVAAGLALAVLAADRACAELCRSSWALGGLGPLVAAGLCSRLPRVRGGGGLGELPEGRMGLRTEARLGRQLTPPPAQQGREDLVHELRRLTSRLLQPVVPLAAMPADDPAFFNKILAELWPYVCGFVENDILRGEVQAVVHREVTGALQFDRVSLGSEPIQAHRSWVLPPTSRDKAITLALDVELEGKDIDMTLKLVVSRINALSVSVKRLSIRGILFVSFRHVVPHLPFMQGLNVYFANPPQIEMELSSPSGAVSLLPENVRAGLVASVSRGISRTLVLPNRVAVPFGRLWPLHRLKFARPEALLRCRVLGVRGAPHGQGHLEGLTGYAPEHRALYCRLQLGAQIWDSREARSSDGDFMWDERAALVVDQQANQELSVTLHERHTLSDVQVTGPRTLGIMEVSSRSSRQHAPLWPLPCAEGLQGSPRLLLSAALHPLTRSRGALCEGLGSLLVVTVDSLRQVPAAYEGKSVLLRAFVVDEGCRPDPTAEPDAQTTQARCSRVPPSERSRCRMQRLLARNFEGAECSRWAADGVDEEGGPQSSSDESGSDHDPAEAPGAGFIAADASRWAERLQYLWRHFRAADHQHLSDWVAEDRDARVHVLAGLLGVPCWEEARLGQLVDDLVAEETPGLQQQAIRHRLGSSLGARLRTWARGGGAPSGGNRGGAAAAEATRPPRRQAPPAPPHPATPEAACNAPECLWRQQLRLAVAAPAARELYLEALHVTKRSEARSLGHWRCSLRELMIAGRMADPMRSRALEPGGGPHPQGSSAVPAGPRGLRELPELLAQVELFHLLPARVDLPECGGAAAASAGPPGK